MGIGTRIKFGGRSKKKQFVDPLGLKKSTPDIAKTAEELALERRQRTLLDKEIGESERRFKSLARGRQGSESLLSGSQPSDRKRAIRRPINTSLLGSSQGIGASPAQSRGA